MRFLIFSISLIMAISAWGKDVEPEATVTPASSPGMGMPSASGKNPAASKIKTFATFFTMRNLITDSENFAAFIDAMYPYLIPGDDVFIQDLLKKYPQILRQKNLPKFSFEGGMTTLSSDAFEMTLRIKDLSKFEFDMNGTTVFFDPGVDSLTRWKALSKVPRITRMSSISFLPIAYAIEKESVPTVMDVVGFAMLSRYVRSSSALNTKLRIGKNQVRIEKIWTISKNLKGLAAKMSCTTDLLVQISQKLAEIDSSEVSCRRGDFIFELPTEDNKTQKFILNHEGRRVEVYDAAGKPQMSFVKSNIVEKLNADEQKTKGKVQRMKGARWSSIGAEDPLKTSTIEHVRELVNFATYTQFCGLCESFLKKAIIQAMAETGSEAVLTTKSTTSSLKSQPQKSQMATPSAPSNTVQAPSGAASSFLESTPLSPNGQPSAEGPLPIQQAMPSPPQGGMTNEAPPAAQQVPPPAKSSAAAQGQSSPPPAQDLGAPQMMDLPPDMK